MPSRPNSLTYTSIALAAMIASAMLASTVLAGCSSADRSSELRPDSTLGANTAVGSSADTVARLVVGVSGFQTPESVTYDAGGDMFYVSSINGGPNDRDNNGFITRMLADGQIDSLKLVSGGRGGVTLHAPKGILVVGDTVWVTDIDVVRGFDKRTGAPVATIDFRPLRAAFLNDLARGPDGIYVTDTGIRFTGPNISQSGQDRVFRIASDRSISVAVTGDTLGGPNGIAWDAANNRFVLGGFGTPNVYTWKPGDAAPAVLARGAGQYDGVAVLTDGRIMISSWADSSVSVVDGDRLRPVITGVAAPADFDVDSKRRRFAIPRFEANRVELWSIPAR